MYHTFRTVTIEADERPTIWKPGLIRIKKNDGSFELAIHSESLPEDVLRKLCSIHENNVAEAIEYIISNLKNIKL